MFDRLIVSEPDREAVKNRRSYFMVSSLVVGVLFLTAVVVSIFAADFSLGNGGLELTELIAPPDMAATAPEPVRQPQASPNRTNTSLPSRTDNIQNVAEATPRVPDAISTTPNAVAARPLDSRFVIGPENTNPWVTGRDIGDPGPSDPRVGLSVAQNKPEPTEDTPPASVDPPRKPPVQTLGVINGNATYLPKPVYSAAATAVHAGGKVDVQVAIDETGRVTSAKAINGHPLLKQSAEQAARNAKFSVTYLSHVPVKVTGVIVYNFIR
jgi:TonB family protein